MGWKIYDESVEIVEQRFQYFPRRFRWRGRHYVVDAVERCWTVSRLRWRRRVERRYFQVQCIEGRFELFQDLRTGAWHLRRAKLVQLGRNNSLVSGSMTQPAWQ